MQICFQRLTFKVYKHFWCFNPNKPRPTRCHPEDRPQPKDLDNHSSAERRRRLEDDQFHRPATISLVLGFLIGVVQNTVFDPAANSTDDSFAFARRGGGRMFTPEVLSGSVSGQRLRASLRSPLFVFLLSILPSSPLHGPAALFWLGLS